MARAIARRTNALIAPTIPYGMTGSLEAYPGAFQITARMRQGEGGAGAGSLVLPTGDRVPLDDRALARVLVRYPAMTLQVIGLIHWEALKQHWRRVPYRRPGPDHHAL